MGVVVVWWMLIWSWNFWRKPREHVPATSLTKSTWVGSPRELRKVNMRRALHPAGDAL